MKNCFGEIFDDFLGKGSVLAKKLAYFFNHKLGTEYFII